MNIKNQVLEKFIPINKIELTDFIFKKFKDKDQKQELNQLCRLIESIYHYKFFKELNDIKSAYLNLDPDISSTVIKNYSKNESNQSQEIAMKKTRYLLEKANYIEITKDDMDDALKRISPWGLKLEVDFSDFKNFFIYYKGKYKDSKVKKSFFFNKKYNFDVFSRVVILFQLKGKEVKRKDNLLYNKLYLKLFKNVPAVDLEMIFPNTKILINIFDKLMIILPLICGIGTTVYKITNFILTQGKAVPFWSQIGFWGIIGGFFGLSLRSFLGYQSTVEKYLKNLTTSLYFQNLDNNSGVFDYILDNAEEEEYKEALLSYFFLLREKKINLDHKTLDNKIEDFFIKNFNKKFDFEIEDSLNKLKELGLLRIDKGFLKITGIRESIKKLQKIWDDFFI